MGVVCLVERGCGQCSGMWYRLVSVLEDVGTSEELLSETIITLGSFAHGEGTLLQGMGLTCWVV